MLVVVADVERPEKAVGAALAVYACNLRYMVLRAIVVLTGRVVAAIHATTAALVFALGREAALLDGNLRIVDAAANDERRLKPIGRRPQTLPHD